MNTKAFFQRALMLFVALLICVISFAQKTQKNLVPNPGFEKHKNKSININNAIPWQGEGTVDYYMSPEKSDTSRYRGAHSGTCFVGLRFQANYKEYLYVQLTEPLQKGKVYNFIMYVRLVGCSTVTLKQLGVYFSDRSFKVGMNFDQEGILDSTYSNGISASLGWIPIQGEHIAQGGEKFIILGNFRTKMKDDFVRINKWDIFEMREAYYYIDDVSLYSKTESTDLPIDNKIAENLFFHSLPDTLSSGQVIEIKDLGFENEGEKLLKSSYKILDELVRYLNNHPFMEIQINGYSFDQEKEAENKRYSKTRAKAVYDYLLSQSVINPMTYKGFGSSRTVDSNDSTASVENNWRLEFLIIKEE